MKRLFDAVRRGIFFFSSKKKRPGGRGLGEATVKKRADEFENVEEMRDLEAPPENSQRVLRRVPSEIIELGTDDDKGEEGEEEEETDEEVEFRAVRTRKARRRDYSSDSSNLDWVEQHDRKHSKVTSFDIGTPEKKSEQQSTRHSERIKVQGQKKRGQKRSFQMRMTKKKNELEDSSTDEEMLSYATESEESSESETGINARDNKGKVFDELLIDDIDVARLFYQEYFKVIDDKLSSIDRKKKVIRNLLRSLATFKIDPENVVGFLLDCYQELKYYPNTRAISDVLQRAFLAGNVAVVERIKLFCGTGRWSPGEGFEWPRDPETHRTFVHEAVANKKGNVDVVRLALETETNRDIKFAKDVYGESALVLCAYDESDRVDIVRALIEGAEYSASDILEDRDTEGLNAIFAAASSGALNILKYLIGFVEKHSNENDVILSKTEKGKTLAHFAADRMRKEVLEWLYEKQPQLQQTKDLNGVKPMVFETHCPICFEERVYEIKSMAKEKERVSINLSCGHGYCLRCILKPMTFNQNRCYCCYKKLNENEKHQIHMLRKNKGDLSGARRLDEGTRRELDKAIDAMPGWKHRVPKYRSNVNPASRDTSALRTGGWNGTIY